MIEWQKIEATFLAVADLPAGEQSAALDSLCNDNAEFRREVESLLRADTGSEETIDCAIRGIASAILDAPVLVGERLGAYRVVREIGRGGMGSVYLAVRDDDEYTKEVALKVVKRGMNTEEVLQRFRAERQILANLDHPFIARLFDGGTTQAGLPFFAMEFVEGRPIDVFCRENALDAKARCKLFLRILEAVSYAHRNLILHGDLKPANIFVKADGTPKLLDFGVAKLMHADEPPHRTARPEARAFTPRYASPEQMRGTFTTISTDIYSLGAVLYQLLIRERARPVRLDGNKGRHPAASDIYLERPGQLPRGLPADLVDVVLMAMCIDPERRYQSAEQFASDIHRSLEGRPVIAREGTIRYRMQRFLARNALQVALAVVVASALIGGLLFSLEQTHRARLDRAAADAQSLIALQERVSADAARASEAMQRNAAERQRRIADEQRGIAEVERDEAKRETSKADQRLQDIMQLASSTLFAGNNAIASLPGSLPARQKLVQTTLTYLQTLEKDAANNKDMQDVLTEAYYKLALVQYDPHGPSMGDAASSEKSLHKAEETLRPAYQRRPDDPGLMLRLIEVRGALADLLFAQGRREESVQIYIGLLPVAHRLALAKGCSLNCETQEPVMENFLAIELSASDPARALEFAEKGITADRAVIARHPTEQEPLQGLGSLTSVAAQANRNLGHLGEAATDFQTSIAIREELLRADPGNHSIRRNLMVAYGNYALLLGMPWSPNLGRFGDARLFARKSVDIARTAVAADSGDVTAHHDLAVALARLGMIEPAEGEVEASMGELREAEQLANPLVTANTKSLEAATLLAQILAFEGHRFEQLGRLKEARAAYQRSLALLQPLVMEPKIGMSIEYIRAEEDLALLQAASGDETAAMSTARDVLASAEKYASATPLKIAAQGGAWAVLARVEAKTQQLSAARESAEKAQADWESIHNPGLLTAYRAMIAANHVVLSELP
jgi:eukaryotic-like serine/threonine-protein kinase